MKIVLVCSLMVFFGSEVTAQLPQWQTLVDQARWASNAHNVQSWKLVPVAGREDQKRLILDSARLLPETDPPSRQLTISLGAFIAVLQKAACARGAQVLWEPLPNQQKGALLSLLPGQKRLWDLEELDALTRATVKYRTSELALSDVQTAADEALSTAVVRVRWIGDTTEVNEAKSWAIRAFDLEMNLDRTRNESIRYTQLGEQARKSRPYGITLLPNFPQSQLYWVELFAGLFPQSANDYSKSAKQLFGDALRPVQQLLILTSRGSGVAEQLETGVVLQQLWLNVRARGGELLPLSQGLEEYPEMAAEYSWARARWASKGETVQMVLALFKPEPGPFLRSPRIEAGKLFGSEE